MSEWKQQLELAAECLRSGRPSEAFLKSFGALEFCFGTVAGRFGVNGSSNDDRFAQVLRVLVDRKLLLQQEFRLASHIANSRNLIAHELGFEPSPAQVEKTIRHIERLCSKFGTSVSAVMRKPVLTATADEPVSKFIPDIVNKGISQIPVVSENEIIGTLNDTAVLSAWEKGEGLLDVNTPVRELMSDKVLPSVSANFSIEEARKVMIEKKTPAVLILHAGLPQGILTRFDLLEHVGATP